MTQPMSTTPMLEPRIPASRIVVLMPNWLGDACMATPFLRALRELYPNAHIAAVGRPLVQPVLAGLPFIDESQTLYKKKQKVTRDFLKNSNFDLAILLPNSFRTAWLAFRAKIKNRLGYARGGRSLLLTHKIKPIKRTRQQKKLDQKKSTAIFSLGGRHMKIGSKFQPLPTIDYYLKLTHFLGAPESASNQMQLAITDEERTQAEQFLAEIENQNTKIETLIVLVPGANFGSSKCYPPQHFATLALQLTENPANHILIASSPKELPLINAILKEIEKRVTSHESRATNQIHSLAHFNNNAGLPLGALKELVRRSQLMICNDTGPRHIAAAFNIPTVTLFGPTDPRWAETYSKSDRQLSLPQSQIPCSPCQLKKCPIDHRCMNSLNPNAVLTQVATLLPSLTHRELQPTNHEPPAP